MMLLQLNPNVLLCCIPWSSYVESHVPVSKAYHLSDIFADLLNFSAHHLVMGGRLVYWLPIYRSEWVHWFVLWQYMVIVWRLSSPWPACKESPLHFTFNRFMCPAVIRKIFFRCGLLPNLLWLTTYFVVAFCTSRGQADTKNESYSVCALHL